MKKTFLLLGAILTMIACLPLSGCQTFETLGDYISENPVFVSVATRQAVGRYVAAGKTPEDEVRRARDVQSRISKILVYLDEDKTAGVDDLLVVIDSVIDWDALDPMDRLLVSDIIVLVEAELRKFEHQSPSLTADTRLALRGLFKTAMSAAAIYLGK